MRVTDINKMTQKELQRLRRRDLLTVMLDQAKLIDQLEESVRAEKKQNELLREEIAGFDRRSAEPAFSVPSVARRNSAVSAARVAGYMTRFFKEACVIGRKRLAACKTAAKRACPR